MLVVVLQSVVSFSQFHRAHERGVVSGRKSAALVSGGHFRAENRPPRAMARPSCRAASVICSLCGCDAPQKTEMCIVMFLFSLPSHPLWSVAIARKDGSRFLIRLEFPRPATGDVKSGRGWRRVENRCYFCGGRSMKLQTCL